MLLPFEFAILTIAESNALLEGIRNLADPKRIADKSRLPNYKKIIEVGLMDLYNRLDEFVYNHRHYESLKNFDPYAND